MEIPPETFEDPAVMERARRDKEYMAVEQLDHQSPEEKKLDYKRPLLDLQNEANTQAFLKGITIPTLLIGGTEDPISDRTLWYVRLNAFRTASFFYIMAFPITNPGGFLWKKCLQRLRSF